MVTEKVVTVDLVRSEGTTRSEVRTRGHWVSSPAVHRLLLTGSDLQLASFTKQREKGGKSVNMNRGKEGRKEGRKE